jgi:hypothetical protein
MHGANARIPNSVCFVDARQLLYLGGNQAVIEILGKSSQKFIQLGKGFSGFAPAEISAEGPTRSSPISTLSAQFSVTAATLSPKKQYFALAFYSNSNGEEYTKQPASTVRIYETVTRKLCKCLEVPAAISNKVRR